MTDSVPPLFYTRADVAVTQSHLYLKLALSGESQHARYREKKRHVQIIKKVDRFGKPLLIPIESKR